MLHRGSLLAIVLLSVLACERSSEPAAADAAPTEPAVTQAPTSAPGPAAPASTPSPATPPAPADAEPDTPPATAPVEPTPPEAAPAPAAAPMPELYADGFYRSEGGRAIVAFPDSIAEDGKLDIGESDGKRMLTGKSKDGAVSVFVSIFPPGDYDSLAMAKKIRSELAASMAATINLDELPLRSVDEAGAGGHVFGFRHGPHTNGAIATIVLIADGRDAVVLLALGREAETDAAVSFLVDHTRVGSKVPKLDDRAPSQRLDGMYTTRARAVDGSLVAQWLMVDPRGYLHDMTPRTDANIDMAAMVQSAALGLARAYTYDLRDGKITMTPLHPGAPAREADLTTRDQELVLGGVEFTRVDGMIADGSTFEGSWEYYNGTSLPSFGGEYMGASTTKRFTFGPGNAISFRGGTSIIGSSNDEFGLLDSTLSAYVRDGTWSGTYEVAGGKLIVKTSDGLTLSQPIAAVLFNGAKSEKSVTIGGLIYNKD